MFFVYAFSTNISCSNFFVDDFFACLFLFSLGGNARTQRSIKNVTSNQLACLAVTAENTYTHREMDIHTHKHTHTCISTCTNGGAVLFWSIQDKRHAGLQHVTIPQNLVSHSLFKTQCCQNQNMTIGLHHATLPNQRHRHTLIGLPDRWLDQKVILTGVRVSYVSVCHSPYLYRDIV